MKLHSQGPDFFSEAETAYKELFQSEIFTYPESLSEVRWLELYGDGEIEDEDDDLEPETLGPTTSSDGTPSTLPQILYLAYKNYGLFQLDQLRHKLAQIEVHLQSVDFSQAGGVTANIATTGLEYLAEALGRDETDLELWRIVARVSEYLGSQRLARYCLEAVIENDGTTFDDQLEFLGLDEHFARERLNLLLNNVVDRASETQLQFSGKKRKALKKAIQRYIDPCSYLPITCQRSLGTINDHRSQRIEIVVPSQSWAAAGKAILLSIQQGEKGIMIPTSGSNYSLKTPLQNHDFPRDSQSLESSDKQAQRRQNSMANYRADTDEYTRTNDNTQRNIDQLSQSIGLAIPIRHNTEITSSADFPKGIGQNASQDLPLVNGDVLPTVIDEDHHVEMPANKTIRKRSSDEADLPELNDAVRSRSKRIKARASAADSVSNNAESAEEWAKWFAEQLQIYVQADELAFRSADKILSTLRCKLIGPFDRLKEALLYAADAARENESMPSDDIAIRALKQLLETWDLSKSRAFLNGGGLQDLTRGSQPVSISSYLEQSMREAQPGASWVGLPDNYRLEEFITRTKVRPLENVNELATHWLYQLLTPQDQDQSFYTSHLWSDVLKETVVQILVQVDEYILSSLRRSSMAEVGDTAILVQTIFELHLDIYGRITNPSSIVDETTRTLQRDRLCRWASFASEVFNRFELVDAITNETLEIRFLWSTVAYNNLVEASSTEHTVICYRDLIKMLRHQAKQKGVEQTFIYLINNALIPEISVKAAEREIARLTTIDFFTSVFSLEDEDPFATIDNLEPLLRMSVDSDVPSNSDDRSTVQTIHNEGPETPVAATQGSTLLEAQRFLKSATPSLRLFLWQKLRDAYSVINYPSMILFCNLRSLALIVDHLGSQMYVDVTTESDAESYLHWMHQVDTLMTQILALMVTDSNAFECIDDDHVRSLMNTLVSLVRIVHVFALWEDSIRVGQVQPPIQVSTAGVRAQVKSAEKFRDMIVRTWSLQYLIFKEGIQQNISAFESAEKDLLDYLKLVHCILGLRTYCGLANKAFLKLAKVEMLRLKPCEGWDNDMPQIISDLHGLKITSQTSQVMDHACEPTEIDKHTAFEVLDLVMLHVHRMSMKDLLKSDLKFAVDKLQQVIKVPKISSTTAARTFNKRLVNNYLKSPINPIDLFRSVRGIGGLSSMPARTEGWEIAQQGWYFLLGHLSLAKWRSLAQKRTGAGSTEDLENAKVFFKLDLEFDTERWETWYRLGQVFNALLEEYTTWTADRLDNDMAGLVELQRQSILCYNVALAIATRYTDPSFETTNKIAELCADYGARIYSSSREPFSMQAFSLHEYERHYNGVMQGMYKREPFKPVYLYPAWKLASALLKKACLQNPNDWMNFYLRGKVLWKMHSYNDGVLNAGKRIQHQLVINTFIRAVKCVPEKRDSRHPDRPMILEPHYKLLSIVHKMVTARVLTPQLGCRTLKATQYARKVPDVQDSEEWVDYMQEVLKALRLADKSNWHHRMVARAANTIYETDPDDLRTWLGAKHELTQQMFTKTMTIQIWRPENERPGRHFVYTGRYVRFFIGILYRLKDKDSMEALARRIRKRGGDFVNHTTIWHELSFAYLAVSFRRSSLNSMPILSIAST